MTDKPKTECLESLSIGGNGDPCCEEMLWCTKPNGHTGKHRAEDHDNYETAFIAEWEGSE